MLERSRSVSKRLTQMGVVTGCDNGFPSPVSLLTSRLWVFLSRLIVDDEVSNLLKMKRACCKIGVDSHSQSASAFHFRHTTTFIRKVQSSLYDWIQQNTKVFQVKINQHILHNSPALGAVSLFLFLFSLFLLFLFLFWRAGVGCIEKLLSANHNKGYKNAYIHTWTKHTHE